MNQADMIVTTVLAALVAFGGIRTFIEIANDGFGRVPNRSM